MSNAPLLPSSSMPSDLIARMLPVIRRIAERLARRLPLHVRVDDLTSAGHVGLISAYQRFDPARGDDFDAYAERRIRGAMLDELRASDVLSRDLRSQNNQIAAAARTIEQRHGRRATEEDVARELDLPLDVVQTRMARAASSRTVSLDEPLADGGMIQIADDHMLPEEQLLRQEKMAAVSAALTSLPPRLRRVIELYYKEGRTLREIGAILGVTESRACQIHGEAVLQMRMVCISDEPASRRRSMRREAAPRSIAQRIPTRPAIGAASIAA